jgi:serine/alanine adding enzyme
MTLRVVDSAGDEAWDELVARCADANIFHSREYIGCFAGSKRYVPFSVFLEEDGRLVAGMVGLHNRMFGSRLPGLSSRAVVYGGVLVDDGVNDGALDGHVAALLSAYDGLMRRRSLFTEIRNVADAARLVEPLSRCGYEFEPHLNYLIDLRDGHERVLRAISSRLRRKIKRARKSVDVVEVGDDAGLEEFYALVAETYSRVHIPFFDLDVFRSVFRRLHPLGRVRFTLAVHDGRTIASRAALVFRGRVFDWFAGSNAEGNSLNANAWSAYEMMEWGCGAGMDVFDFGGAGDPRQPYGVRDFKSRFHGELVDLGRFTKIYSRPRYALSRLGYRLARRFLY